MPISVFTIKSLLRLYAEHGVGVKSRRKAKVNRHLFSKDQKSHPSMINFTVERPNLSSTANKEKGTVNFREVPLLFAELGSPTISLSS